MVNLCRCMRLRSVMIHVCRCEGCYCICVHMCFCRRVQEYDVTSVLGSTELC